MGPTRLRRHQIRTASRLRYVKYRVQQVPRWIVTTTLFWLLAELVTYSAVILYWLFKDWGDKVINPWWSPWYSNPMIRIWWIKFLSEHVSRLIYYYAACRVAVRIGDLLFLMAIIFLCFRIFDIWMFFWNFCRSELVYADAMFTLISIMWTVFKGYKPETVAKVKSLF